MRRHHAHLLLAVGACLLATWSVPSPAAAHAIELVGKQDLPIPRWLFGWGAAAVLLLSFLALGALWRTPRLAQGGEREVLQVPRAVEVVCGAIGIAVWVALVYIGLAGTQEGADNLLPTWVFVVFWIAIPMLCAVAGDVFRAFNPWRAAGRAVGWAAGRLRPGGAEPLPYPERLGHWPAAAGILVFAYVELVYADRNDPSTLAMLVIAYTAVQLIGMTFFGVRAWSDRGDAFGVYFGLFASLAPLRWRDGKLWARPPLSGTAGLVAVPGTVALLCVMIGSTSFDGFTVTNLWNTILRWELDRLQDLGFSPSGATPWALTIGLLAVIGVITLLYRLGVLGMRTVDRAHPAGELARRFAPSLVPIALAYVVAHYFGLLSYQGQAVPALATDPLGDGSDLFGLASATVDYGWISATAIWYVQVGALVAGHAAGLAIAHDRALVIYDTPRQATRSQAWMLGVMVLFTCLALWLLSALTQS